MITTHYLLLRLLRTTVLYSTGTVHDQRGPCANGW